MTNAIEQLCALVAPPAHVVPSSESEWRRACQALGTQVPRDYVDLASTYGLGSFDNFLWIFHPVAEPPPLSIVGQAEAQLDALRVLEAQGEPMPYVVAEGSSELIPWAVTDNGDVCYWLTQPRNDPDEWTVVVNESRGPDWDRFDGSVTEFLVAVLGGRTKVSVFPDDFPGRRPTFTPRTAS